MKTFDQPARPPRPCEAGRLKACAFRAWLEAAEFSRDFWQKHSGLPQAKSHAPLTFEPLHYPPTGTAGTEEKPFRLWPGKLTELYKVAQGRVAFLARRLDDHRRKPPTWKGQQIDAAGFAGIAEGLYWLVGEVSKFLELVNDRRISVHPLSRSADRTFWERMQAFLQGFDGNKLVELKKHLDTHADFFFGNLDPERDLIKEFESQLEILQDHYARPQENLARHVEHARRHLEEMLREFLSGPKASDDFRKWAIQLKYFLTPRNVQDLPEALPASGGEKVLPRGNSEAYEILNAAEYLASLVERQREQRPG